MGPLVAKIRNKEELLAHGVGDSRSVVLELTEQVLQRLDSYERLKAFVHLEGNLLHVGNRVWDLTKKRHVYVFNAGKAANHMARAMDEILGKRLTKGIAIVKILQDEDHYSNTARSHVEDPVDENDWGGWQKAAHVLDRTILVGDDLTVTNINKLKKAVEMKACEAFIFKPNQVGTITESLEALEYAKAHGIIAIPSVRAGGVVDDPIFDIAVAFGCCAARAPPKKW